MGGGVTLSTPESLSPRHDSSAFSSGVLSLDDWLKRRALGNQAAGASRTFVVCRGDAVVAYYALASGGVSTSAVTGRFRRNRPDPIPVAIPGRLAVDLSVKRQGLGRALFRDAAKRVLHAGDAIGIRGILVHAISDDAKSFYIALGFDPSPLEPMTLMVTIADLRRSL